MRTLAPMKLASRIVAAGRKRCQPARGAGEVVGLLGPNGAGKTTTFYALLV